MNTSSATFQASLDQLRSSDSLQQEVTFQRLIPSANQHVPELIAALEAETDREVKRYLLALLAATKSSEAKPIFLQYQQSDDDLLKSWAVYGLEKLEGPVREGMVRSSKAYRFSLLGYLIGIMLQVVSFAVVFGVYRLMGKPLQYPPAHFYPLALLYGFEVAGYLVGQRERCFWRNLAVSWRDKLVLVTGLMVVSLTLGSVRLLTVFPVWGTFGFVGLVIVGCYFFVERLLSTKARENLKALP